MAQTITRACTDAQVKIIIKVSQVNETFARQLEYAYDEVAYGHEDYDAGYLRGLVMALYMMDIITFEEKDILIGVAESV